MQREMGERPGKGGRWIVALAAVCALTAVSSVALAGGMWLPARGVGPLGRAGAVVASLRDPNALWYNPANLALVEGNQLLLDVAMIDMAATFERAAETSRSGELTTFGIVENEALPQWSPQLISPEGRTILGIEDED